MGLRTPLYELHVALGAKMVDFGGWDMPLHYGSQVEEHHQVRRDCGVFDVSHMTVVDVAGEQATAYLQHLLANDVARLGETGKALYSAMLNEEGGVVDDLIVYLTEHGYRVVVNASTRDKDIAWMQAQAAGFKVDLQERGDLAMLAIQGPNARVHSSELVSPARAALIRELKPFQAVPRATGSSPAPATPARTAWKSCCRPPRRRVSSTSWLAPGSPRRAWSARDTLRLEAGLNLYGQDMDESVSPLAANMGWTVAWVPVARDFVGRRALEAQKSAGDQPKLVGLVLEERGVLRAHQVVRVAGIGEGRSPAAAFRLP